MKTMRSADNAGMRNSRLVEANRERSVGVVGGRSGAGTTPLLHHSTVLPRGFCHRLIFIATMLVAVAFASARALQDAEITVHAGGRQVYKGMGATQTLSSQQGYSQLPDSIRDSMSSFLWRDLGFRYLRLRSTIRVCPDTADYCAEELYHSYKQIIEDASRYAQDLQIMLGPDDVVGEDLQDYARRFARQIATLRDSGFAITHTGIANEPDWQNYLLNYEVPLTIRHFREQLDSLGLSDVKIVAPENSSADWKAREFVDFILADTQALAALDAFATHSYNWSITEEMEQRVESHVASGQKEYWQTEAAGFGNEKWGDAMRAASIASRFLADMNHLCNVWFVHVGVRGVDTDWNMDDTANTSFYTVLYRTAEQDWGPLLKAYYLKQLNQTIPASATFRKATTNVRQLGAKYWREEDSTMVYAYCDTSNGERKAPLFLAAAANLDGSWGIGLTNYTSDSVPLDPGSMAFQSAENYRVTVKIEELENTTGIKFTMHRTNSTPPYTHFVDTVTMDSGKVVIDSIGSFDLITLRSAPGVTSVHPRSSAGRLDGANSGLSVVQSGAGISFAFRTPDNAGRSTNVSLTLHDTRGRTVETLFSGVAKPGENLFSWDGAGFSGRGVAAGAYVARLTVGATTVATPVVISH